MTLIMPQIPIGHALQILISDSRNQNVKTRDHLGLQAQPQSVFQTINLNEQIILTRTLSNLINNMNSQNMNFLVCGTEEDF